MIIDKYKKSNKEKKQRIDTKDKTKMIKNVITVQGLIEKSTILLWQSKSIDKVPQLACAWNGCAATSQDI